MSKRDKLLSRVLSGHSDKGIRFDELCFLLRYLGFEERSRGSHRLFTRPGIEELVNLQNTGGIAKAYQVRQVRRVLTQYGLGGEE